MVLLVVDFQKALTEDEELYNAKTFIERVVKLVETARRNNVEVIFVQHDAGPGSGFSVGDPDFEIDAHVTPAKGEKVFIKTINSCFGNKDFLDYMYSLEDKRVMVVGLQTNWCIDATVKSAFERGFEVIIPDGTNSTFDNDYMSAETTYRYYNEEIWPDCFADCVSFDEAVSMLEK
ncbi:MAG: isochorismatase family protein [Spirochaetales bacterium]|nr:isochorismatase family protein [Spirochaetales bacterium]